MLVSAWLLGFLGLVENVCGTFLLSDYADWFSWKVFRACL